MPCRTQGILEGSYSDSAQMNTILKMLRSSESISIYAMCNFKEDGESQDAKNKQSSTFYEGLFLWDTLAQSEVPTYPASVETGEVR